MERLSRLRFMNVDRTRLPVRDRIRPRGVPNALQDSPVVDTTLLAEALDVTSQLLGPCTLAPRPGDAVAFHCRLHAIQFLDVSMAYLDYATPTRLTVPRSADCYTVHMTSAGHASVHIGGESHELTPFSALVISPGTAYTMDLDRSSPQNIVRVR